MAAHRYALFPFPLLKAAGVGYDAKAGVQLRIDHLTAFPGINKTFVMVGDSLTANADWSAMFSAPVVNHGVSGDTTASALTRIPQITATKARTALIMLGINDIREGVPISEIVSRFAQLVKSLEAAGMSVIVQSTLLTLDRDLNEQVVALNIQLDRMCDSLRCLFLNLNSAISQEGSLSTDFAVDEIHLNVAGYMRWRDYISPIIQPP